MHTVGNCTPDTGHVNTVVLPCFRSRFNGVCFYCLHSQSYPMKCLLIESLPTTDRGSTNCSERPLEVGGKVRHYVNSN